jgi:hypothetical protein
MEFIQTVRRDNKRNQSQEEEKRKRSITMDWIDLLLFVSIMVRDVSINTNGLRSTEKLELASRVAQGTAPQC